jgi:hypothetical protein
MYNEFAKSVREWLPTARYESARTGGVPVRRLVMQPFAFSVE